MKKKEYSTTTVLLVIFLLAIFVVFPPVMRVLFPAEEDEVVSDTKTLLTCTKNGSDLDPYNVTSAIYFVNNVAEKNSINFFMITEDNSADSGTIDERVEDVVIQQNVVDETVDSGIVTAEGETSGEDNASVQRTITQELEFFRSLSGVNFTDNGTSYSVVITVDSLNENSGNLELNNYLSSETEMYDFYTNLGYTCYSETY